MQQRLRLLLAELLGHLQLEMGELDETPWAVVQRLRGGGAGLPAIVAALQAKGLSREDIELLLDGAPELTASRDAGNAAAAKVIRPPPQVLQPVDYSFVFPWSGIVASLVAALIGAGLMTLPEVGWLGAVVVAPALIVFAAVLRLELRKGVVRTLRALGMVLVVLMGFALFTSGVTSHLGPFQAGVALLALVGVGLVVYGRTRTETLKGVRDFCQGSKVYEENDVQWVVTLPEKPALGPGEWFDAVITAQCCVDAPRELVVEIDADVETVEGERLHRFALRPGEVIELTVPVRIGALPPERSEVIVALTPLGQGGRRVVLSSGADWVNPKRAALNNLGAVLDLVVNQELDVPETPDGRVWLRIDPKKPIAMAARAPSQRALFTPSADELTAAAKT